MRWWGWGEDAGAIALPDAAGAMLRTELGLDGSERGQRVTLEGVTLPQSSFDPAVQGQLAAAVGEDGVRNDHLSRVSHAAGKSYPDLVRLRAGDASTAPDAVVAPSSA